MCGVVYASTLLCCARRTGARQRGSALAPDHLGSPHERGCPRIPGVYDRIRRARLALAGMAPEVSVFRLRQALAGIAGLVLACLVLTARPASSLRASILPLCACALIGSLLGVAGMDRFLTFRAHARQRAIDVAVPDCAELLALAVAAGESIPPPSSVSPDAREVPLGRNCR